MSTASAMVSRMPRRTTAWSSHKITRIMGVLLVVAVLRRHRLGGEGNGKYDRGAARRRAHVQPAVDLGGALLETEQPEVLGLAQGFGAHALDVVAHFQGEHVFPVAQVDLH